MGKTNFLNQTNSRLFINIYQQGASWIVKANVCSLSGDSMITYPEDGTGKTLSYQEAVITVAKTLMNNRKFLKEYVSQADFKPRRPDTSTPGAHAPTPPSTTATGPAGGGSAGTPRREAPPASATPDRSLAQIISEDLLSVGTWCGLTLQPSETNRGKVFYAQITEWKRAHTVWITNKADTARTYVIFASAPDVFTNIDEGKRHRFFVVTDYAAATKLSDKITVTQTSGTSEMTLQELKEVLIARNAA